jgi:Methylamine utilisation protein MauE
MDPLITIIISISMSLLFGIAAVHKLRAVAVFRAAMDEYQLIPRQLSGPVAIFLIVTELLAATLVLIPPARAPGFVVMAGLLFIYTTGISINLLRGRRDIDCGCSGPASRHELSGWLVSRNLILLVLVLLSLVLPGLDLQGVGWSAQRPLNWLDSLVVLFSVMVASGLYMGLNQLLAQAPRLAALRTGV